LTSTEYLDTTRLEEISGIRRMVAALDVVQCRSRMVPGSRDRRWIQVGGVIGRDAISRIKRSTVHRATSKCSATDKHHGSAATSLAQSTPCQHHVNKRLSVLIRASGSCTQHAQSIVFWHAKTKRSKK
jgi:hypothetical protein